MTRIFHKIKSDKDSRGFSLVELMIALGILSIGMLAITSLLTFSMGVNATARERTEVVSAVQERLEMLIALPYSDVAAGSAAADYYTVAWTVTETAADGSPGTDVKEITVTGTWLQATKGMKDVSISYLKTNILI